MYFQSLLLLLPCMFYFAGAFLKPLCYSIERRGRHVWAPVLRAMMPMEKPNFCSDCGSDQMELRIPENDERIRACCNDCGSIVYSNPKVVVACVVALEEENDTDDYRLLLAKRAIEPRKGYWGIPQGYMEHGETTRQAAAREVYEETGVNLLPDDLTFRAVYNVPGSVQLVYEARIEDHESLDLPETTLESTEIKFFSHNSLPDLCFPTVQWAIDHCRSSRPSSTITAIQQKTKFYDATTDTWSEFEDEAL